MASPCRGEVWLTDFDPTRGHEQAGRRPALVVSVNAFNHGPGELVVVVPLTSKDKRRPLHVALAKGEGGLTMDSWAKTEDIRSVSTSRLVARWGAVAPATMVQLEARLRMLLGL